MGWQDAPVVSQPKWASAPVVGGGDKLPPDPAEHDPSSPEWQAKYGPAAVPFSENLAAGAGKAVVDLARGAGQYLGVVSRDDVAASRIQDAPLMDTGAGKVGNVAGGIATAIPALAIPGVNTVVGAGALGAVYGALQPSESTGETLRNTAIGGASGAAGQYLGGKVSDWAGRKMAERATKKAAEKAANYVRDATLAEARGAGYVVPPATSNPTFINRTLESVSGKAQTQQAAAAANQHVTDKLARESLGLAADAPLTTATLRGIRNKAGGVYQKVKDSGVILTDSQYIDDLAKLAQSVDDIAQDFPDANVGANKEIGELVDSLLQDRFSAKGAVAYLRKLRDSASGNLSGPPDPSRRALGTAQKDAAGALEDMIIRHLDGQGKADLANEFDAARTLIAKTYSVQAALNQGTGSVAAGKLASQLNRGKPLSGGLETAAKFSAAFPKAAAEQLTSPGVSAVDVLTGGIGGATVNPALFGIPAARMGVRGAILSDLFQNAATVPSYQPGTTGTTLLRLLQAQEPLTKAAAIGIPANVSQ